MITLIIACGVLPAWSAGIAQDKPAAQPAAGPAPSTQPAPPGLVDQEQAAMNLAASSPDSASMQALAAIRTKLAYHLLEAARKFHDGDALSLAVAYAASATDLAPDRPVGWIVLSQAYAEFPDSSASLTLAEDAAYTALTLDESDTTVRLMLAQVQFREKFLNSALDNFEKSLTADPKLALPPVVSMMGVAYVLDCQAARGEAFLADFLTRQPAADSARLTLAILLHHQGKDDAAREQLKKVELSPRVTAADRMYAVKLAELWSKEAQQ